MVTFAQIKLCNLSTFLDSLGRLDQISVVMSVALHSIINAVQCYLVELELLGGVRVLYQSAELLVTRVLGHVHH